MINRPVNKKITPIFQGVAEEEAPISQIPESDLSLLLGKLKSDYAMAQKQGYDKPEKLEKESVITRGLEGMQGEQDYENLIDKQIKSVAGLDAPQSAEWLTRPLAALTDSLTGSKLSGGIKENKAAEDQFEILSAYADKKKQMASEKYKQLLGYEDPELKRKASKVDPMVEAFGKYIGQQAGDIFSSGKIAKADASIESFRDTINYLKNNKDSTGKLKGFVANIRGIGQLSDAKLVSHMQQIARESLNSVKETFPGAISNYESRTIMELSFDPKLGPEENIKKLEKAMAAIEKAKYNMQRVMRLSAEGNSAAAMALASKIAAENEAIDKKYSSGDTATDLQKKEETPTAQAVEPKRKKTAAEIQAEIDAIKNKGK